MTWIKWTNSYKLKKKKKLIQEETEDLNIPIKSKAMESVIKDTKNIHASRNTEAQAASLVNYLKHLKKNYYQFFINSSKTQKRKEHFPTQSMRPELSKYQSQTKIS